MQINVKNDIMKKLHNKLIFDSGIVPKEGQRGLLCSNNESIRCPSLSYEFIDSAESEEKVSKAYSIIFEAVLKRRIENGKYKNIKANSDLCPSEHISSGGSADN
jgi:hypothetical protein